MYKRQSLFSLYIRWPFGRAPKMIRKSPLSRRCRKVPARRSALRRVLPYRCCDPGAASGGDKAKQSLKTRRYKISLKVLQSLPHARCPSSPRYESVLPFRCWLRGDCGDAYKFKMQNRRVKISETKDKMVRALSQDLDKVTFGDGGSSLQKKFGLLKPCVVQACIDLQVVTWPPHFSYRQ